MLFSDLVVCVSVAPDAFHGPCLNDRGFRSVNPGAGIGPCHFVLIPVVDAGDVAEDRIGSKLKLELVALVNYPRPGGSPARVVEQSYKALPAGNKGALTFVGDKISLPGYSRLKPKLGGNEQAGKDTYSGTPLQGWVL